MDVIGKFQSLLALGQNSWHLYFGSYLTSNTVSRPSTFPGSVTQFHCVCLRPLTFLPTHNPVHSYSFLSRFQTEFHSSEEELPKPTGRTRHLSLLPLRPFFRSVSFSVCVQSLRVSPGRPRAKYSSPYVVALSGVFWAIRTGARTVNGEDRPIS